MYVDPQRPARLFAEQFEPDGSGYLYRRSRKGAAIRVTADERDRFVSAFNDSLLIGVWILCGGVGLLMVGLVSAAKAGPAGSFNSISSIIGIFGATLIVSIPYFLHYWWIWRAPARELRGRAPVAPERSSKEMRQLRLARLTWRQLGLATLGALLLATPTVRREQLYPGWNHFAFRAAALLFLLIAVQALRKWRFDRKNGGR
jgi:hypothetical protein